MDRGVMVKRCFFVILGCNYRSVGANEERRVWVGEGGGC